MKGNINMHYKNIVIGGMGLAGSTLCFNICRFICEENKQTYSTYLGGGKKLTKKNENKNNINIHKSHYHINKFENENSYNIFVIRDLRDTVSSMKRKTPEKWENNEVGCADYNMGYYKSWNNKRKNFIFKYEDYKANPLEVIKKITEQLGLSFTEDQIKTIHQNAENLKKQDYIPSKQTGKVWNETFLTTKHFTNDGKIGDYKSNLNDDILNKINNKYSWFFKEHKYD